MAIYKTLVSKISISPEQKIKQKDYLKEGSFPVIDQGQTIIGGYSNDSTKCVNGVLPLLVFGDHTRCVKYITFPFCAGADGTKILQPKAGINPRYLYYGTRYLVLTMPDRGYARHYQYIEKMDLPVPTLPVQERIVARIDELFSQLDAGVETLKKTKAQLAVYRQAVLKEAFAGCANKVPFKQIMDSCLGKMLDKEKNRGIMQNYLRNANVRWFNFDLSDVSQMRIEEDEHERFSIVKNDLIICEGGEPGRCAVWEDDTPTFFQKALHRVRFTDGSEPKFYMYYIWFLSQTGALKPYITGTGIKHLTGESLKRMPVITVSVDKQRIIVSKIEEHISVCDQIEQTVDTALQQAEAMRQSILKAAFEGRL